MERTALVIGAAQAVLFSVPFFCMEGRLGRPSFCPQSVGKAAARA